MTTALPRHLSLFGLWLLVVNGLIGAGIFGLPGGAARLAGEYSQVSGRIQPAYLLILRLVNLADTAEYG